MLSERITFFKTDEFKDLTEIGKGTGIVVFSGCHGDFGRVAIKKFYTRSDFKKEIEILNISRHPNIIQLYGVLLDRTDPEKYRGYVMEFAEYGSLNCVIHNRKIIYEKQQMFQWAQQMGFGLQFLHKNKIIHRDIKPENVLVTPSQLKLADFGLSKEDAGTNASLTGGAGTVLYMAPEVIIGERYGFPADIYSLAITIWEIYHKQRPYSQSNNYLLASEVLTGSRPQINPTKMDSEESNFLQRCWHMVPSERPKIKEITEYFSSKCDNTTHVTITGASQETPSSVELCVITIIDSEKTFQQLSSSFQKIGEIRKLQKEPNNSWIIELELPLIIPSPLPVFEFE